MNVLQCNGFGADKSLTKGIIFIALYGKYIFTIVLDNQSTYCLTQIAGPVMFFYIFSFHIMFQYAGDLNSSSG